MRKRTGPQAAAIEALLPVFTLGKPAYATDVDVLRRRIAVEGALPWLAAEPVRSLHEAGVLMLEDADGRLMWNDDMPFDRALQLVVPQPRSVEVQRPWWQRWKCRRFSFTCTLRSMGYSVPFPHP